MLKRNKIKPTKTVPWERNIKFNKLISGNDICGLLKVNYV